MSTHFLEHTLDLAILKKSLTYLFTEAGQFTHDSGIFLGLIWGPIQK